MSPPPDACLHAPATGTPAPGTAAATAAQPPARIRSEKLFSGAQEVQIEHRGLLYRLRLTSLGKLILTK